MNGTVKVNLGTFSPFIGIQKISGDQAGANPDNNYATYGPALGSNHQGASRSMELSIMT